MEYSDTHDVSELKGKILTEIKGIDESDVIFVCDDGSEYRMYHSQSCCESVFIEEIHGDINDLIGVPLQVAEQVSLSEEEEPKRDYEDDCYEWTFYKFATIKGYVTIRWYGTSNGWYSTSVSFEKIK